MDGFTEQQKSVLENLEAGQKLWEPFINTMKEMRDPNRDKSKEAAKAREAKMETVMQDFVRGNDEKFENLAFLSPEPKGRWRPETDEKAPKLESVHPPSAVDLSTLKPMLLKDLTTQSRHRGECIYLIIREVTISNGSTLTVEDSEGGIGTVWSLLDYPFPGAESSIAPGTVIAIKEPAYARSANGVQAVCVHHPPDMVRLSKFDAVIAPHFPALAQSQDVDLTIAGNATFATVKLLDAIDMYSEGIKQASKNDGDSMADSKLVTELLIKRERTRVPA